MKPVTVSACILFASAIAIETIVYMTFLRGLKSRHPEQWMHAAQPTCWLDRTVLSARSTMLYVLTREYMGNIDEAGTRYCSRYRSSLLLAYWCTAVAGIAAVVALAMES